MLVTGIEPSSVILSQTKWFQNLKMMVKNAKNKLKLNGMV